MLVYNTWQSALNTAAQAIVFSVAAGLVLLCFAAVLGIMPWLSLDIVANGQRIETFGFWLQIGLTIFAVMLTVFLPANRRMSVLEQSHRSFAISMDDVSKAYLAVHHADREGVFTLSNEFDAVRARLEFLQRHPDLNDLEPELLQLAAQMSVQSRDIARTYAFDKVERAKTFLTQRQQEIEKFEQRVKDAQATCAQLRLWITDLEIEDRAARKHLRQLDADLREILPMLGYSFDFDDARLRATDPDTVQQHALEFPLQDDHNIVPLNKVTK